VADKSTERMEVGAFGTVVVVVGPDVVVETAAPLVQAAPSTLRAMRQTT
jgi:hypothetical protein